MLGCKIKAKEIKRLPPAVEAESALLLLGAVEVRWGWDSVPTPFRASPPFLLRSPALGCCGLGYRPYMALGIASYSGLRVGGELSWLCEHRVGSGGPESVAPIPASARDSEVCWGRGSNLGFKDLLEILTEADLRGSVPFVVVTVGMF